MADGTFVQAIVSATSKPVYPEVDGEPRLLVPAGWSEVRKPKPYTPAAIVVATIAGLVAYVKANRDKLPLDELVCHVAGPSQVYLYGRCEDEETQYRRKHYLTADLRDMGEAGFSYNVFQASEDVIVGLQVAFEATPERDELVALLGSIKEATVRESVDNGYAQEVTARAGAAFVTNVKVQNPVLLRPYRTFREVEQPESPFIVRLRAGDEGKRPSVALFPADGGAWKLVAIARISEWLLVNLAGTGVAIVA